MSEKQQNSKMFALWVMLVIVLFIVVGMYYLPTKLGEFELKPVDILSELRVDQDKGSDADSLFLGLDEGDDLLAQQRRDSLRLLAMHNDSLRVLARQDSLYRSLKESHVADSVTAEEVLFEDFSPGHTGLKSFFDGLKGSTMSDAPIYIAALGDSFIEADIFTLDVRHLLQQRYGGGGVGWMPLYSQVSGYRQGVTQRSKGWKETTLLQKSKSPFPLSGRSFKASGKASVEYELSDAPDVASSVTRLYYASPQDLEVSYKAGDSTMMLTLPAMTTIGEYTFPISAGKVALSVDNAAEATFYGMSLETDRGVVLDNHSLRGNSGIPFASLDKELGYGLQAERPYRLIILQYGLNVANTKQRNYRSYGNTMIKAVQRLQELFPDASILIMGVSDRGVRESGKFVSMPTLSHFIAEQRRVAQETGVVFWDTYAAMQRLGGIGTFVSKGWAAKDYTHMSFKGGRRLAEEMLKAFDFENKYYEAL